MKRSPLKERRIAESFCLFDVLGIILGSKPPVKQRCVTLYGLVAV